MPLHCNTKVNNDTVLLPCESALEHCTVTLNVLLHCNTVQQLCTVPLPSGSALEHCTSSNTGTLPPTSPVFPPWGTTARRLLLQWPRISATCEKQYSIVSTQCYSVTVHQCYSVTVQQGYSVTVPGSQPPAQGTQGGAIPCLEQYTIVLVQ